MKTPKSKSWKWAMAAEGYCPPRAILLSKSPAIWNKYDSNTPRREARVFPPEPLSLAIRDASAQPWDFSPSGHEDRRIKLILRRAGGGCKRPHRRSFIGRTDEDEDDDRRVGNPSEAARSHSCFRRMGEGCALQSGSHRRIFRGSLPVTADRVRSSQAACLFPPARLLDASAHSSARARAARAQPI